MALPRPGRDISRLICHYLEIGMPRTRAFRLWLPRRIKEIYNLLQILPWTTRTSGLKTGSSADTASGKIPQENFTATR
jgi:hypothetical protein